LLALASSALIKIVVLLTSQDKLENLASNQNKTSSILAKSTRYCPSLAHTEGIA
jgi:hypothetical protein